MSRLKELLEKRAKAHAAAVEFLKAENQTPETRASADKALLEVDELSADIERINKADKVAEQIRNAAGNQETREMGGQDQKPNAKAVESEYRRAFVAALKQRSGGNMGFGREASSSVSAESFQPNIRKAMLAGIDYEKGVNAAMEKRSSMDDMIEQRDLTEGNLLQHIGTYTGLGFFVPTGFVNAIEQATKYFAPLLDGSVITVMDTATGQPLPFPTSNDTTQAASIVGEGNTVNVQDVTANQINFGAYKFTSGLVKCSLELLQDSAFDLEAWLVQRFAERWGRGLEQFLTTGTGSSQPTGIITAILASGIAPIIAAGSSESTGGAQTGVNSIGYSDLVNLEHSVDPTYRRGAQYMFHDQTLSSIKRILDKYGRPLWAPSIREGDPDRVNGYTYVINQSMPQIGASANTVVFGSLKKFIARRVKDLSVMKLVERYAELGQVGFVSFARLDSNLIDAGTHPCNVLQQHS